MEQFVGVRACIIVPAVATADPADVATGVTPVVAPAADAAWAAPGPANRSAAVTAGRRA
jgi:hypothetical protein